MKKISISLFLLLLFLAPACGMKKMATKVVGRVATDGMVAVEGEEDVDFARESAPALIKTIEVLRHGDTHDRNSLVLLSQSYGQYAFGFLEEDMLRFRGDAAKYDAARNRADLFYRRGTEYGIAALTSCGGMREAFKSPFPEFKSALSKLGKGCAPALFWTAFNWASSLNLHLDDPSAIVDLPRIQAIVDRLIELKPEFYFGSGHALKGVISAMRPKMLGGDPALADREFKEAMRIAPAYLMTQVLYAQYYTRQAQDVALFRETLKGVSESDASALPAGRLANELAKRRAKLLLAAEKNLF
ncbi:MAG: TRAP transporter TatT component family protein [Pseudomonadota bacterium]